MTVGDRQSGASAEPTTYRILVAGALDPAWSDRTGGMAVIVHARGAVGATTELIGRLADQAALMGVIDQLYSHGARLMSLECCATERGQDGSTT